MNRRELLSKAAKVGPIAAVLGYFGVKNGFGQEKIGRKNIYFPKDEVEVVWETRAKYGEFITNIPNTETVEFITQAYNKQIVERPEMVTRFWSCQNRIDNDWCLFKFGEIDGQIGITKLRMSTNRYQDIPEDWAFEEHMITV